MMQKGGKVDQPVLKSGDFTAIVRQKLIDSTLSVEQMETTADILLLLLLSLSLLLLFLLLSLLSSLLL